MPDDSELAIVDLMTTLVCTIVDQPRQVFIKAIYDGNRTTLRLRVAPSDIGKVIGKQGRNADSLRTILSALAKRRHRRFILDIADGREVLGGARVDGGLAMEPSPGAETLAR